MIKKITLVFLLYCYISCGKKGDPDIKILKKNAKNSL